MRNSLWLRYSSASVLVALVGSGAIQTRTLPSSASNLAQVGQLYEETRIAGGAEMPDILAVAPDGAFFVFLDPKTFDLSIREIETGIDRNLTNRLAGGDEPHPYLAVVSPDSQRVAYDWGSELRVIDRRGGNPVVLYSDPLKREVIPFDWWPDGKALLVGF